MATTPSTRPVRNHPFWDHSPPFPDADGHRANRLEEERRLGDERWTLTSPFDERHDSAEGGDDE